jgi:hypothetical protein
MAPSLRDWLPEDYLAWFMLATVEEHEFMRRVLATTKPTLR